MRECEKSKSQPALPASGQTEPQWDGGLISTPIAAKPFALVTLLRTQLRQNFFLA